MDLCSACLAAPSAVFARTIKRLLILLALVLFARPGLTQERTMMPVTIDGEQVKIATITYRPTGAGPFPTLIFHHGSTGSGTDPSRFSRTFDPGVLAYWFVARGWAVVLPSRRGRGGSEGLYDEGFSRSRASGYTCDSELSLRGSDRALRDVDAITEFGSGVAFCRSHAVRGWRPITGRHPFRRMGRQTSRRATGRDQLCRRMARCRLPDGQRRQPATVQAWCRLSSPHALAVRRQRSFLSIESFPSQLRGFSRGWRQGNISRDWARDRHEWPPDIYR